MTDNLLNGEIARETLSESFQRGNVFAEQCPSRAVMNHVTSRWGVLCLIALRGGKHRFSELRRKINGISEKMLAQTLQSLESDGFVDRVAYSVVPPRVEYCLTSLGDAIGEKVVSLADWIEINLPEIMAAQNTKAKLILESKSSS